MTDLTAFYRWAQQRLNVHALSPSAGIAVDGVWGAESRAATAGFQRRRGLLANGLLDEKTVAALREGADGRPTAPAGAPVVPPWLAELDRRRGLHEVRDRAKLMAWLRSDGRTLGDPSKLPWCGDAIQTAIALTLPNEPQPTNPYWAKAWLGFGRSCQAVAGAIAVFDRPGGGGHVAVLKGETPSHYVVLGGNQSNAIIETSIARGRLLGFRWPISFPLGLARAAGRAANAAAPISHNEA